MFVNNILFVKYFIQEMEEKVQISCYIAINLIKPPTNMEQQDMVV